MNFKQWLNEMPISQFNLIGNWDKQKPQYGYNKQDYGILTNKKAVDKIHRKWSNTKQNFDLYFIRSFQALQAFRNHGTIGEVSPERLKEITGVEIQPNGDHITAVFTTNLGAEKIPMTAWMIAHRFAHSLYRTYQKSYFDIVERDMMYLLRDIYGINTNNYLYGDDYAKKELYLKALAQALGTMKSARERKIFRYSEFIFDTVAQYIIEGKITLNPLPRFLITKNTKAWGRPNPQGTYAKVDVGDYANEIEALAESWTYILDGLFQKLKGRIFVL